MIEKTINKFIVSRITQFLKTIFSLIYILKTNNKNYITVEQINIHFINISKMFQKNNFYKFLKIFQLHSKINKMSYNVKIIEIINKYKIL